MRNLNDVLFFSAVVEHHGFSAAARALGVPKSRLSRSVSDLEQELGMRLLERSTRTMRLTDVGLPFYEQCKVALDALEDAETIIAQAQKQPSGLLRVSCPPGILHQRLAEQLPRFLQNFPQVRLIIQASNRRIDLVEEHFDVALRVRGALDTEPSHILRVLGESRLWLVASPAWAKAHADLRLEQLHQTPTLSLLEQAGPQTLLLHDAGGKTFSLQHLPLLCCSDFDVIRRAALAGLGLALMPDHSCRHDVHSGQLQRVQPDWSGAPSTVHLIYTSRRGMRPAVRAFIDFAVGALAPHFEALPLH